MRLLSHFIDDGLVDGTLYVNAGIEQLAQIICLYELVFPCQLFVEFLCSIVEDVSKDAVVYSVIIGQIGLAQTMYVFIVEL